MDTKEHIKKSKKGIPLKWVTKEKIKEELLKLNRELGRTPHIRDAKNGLSYACYEYFGSFDKAKDECGLRSSRYKFPKSATLITPNLGYIIGVILSDGNINISKTKQSGLIRLIAKDMDFVRYFAKNLKEWSHKQPTIRLTHRAGNVNCFLNQDRNYLETYISSIEASTFIYKKLGIVHRKNKKLTTPTKLKWILRSNKTFQKNILKGMWDGDGWVTKKRRTKKCNIEICYCGTDAGIIDLFCSICKNFGIPTTIRKRNSTNLSLSKKFPSMIFDKIYEASLVGGCYSYRKFYDLMGGCTIKRKDMIFVDYFTNFKKSRVRCYSPKEYQKAVELHKKTGFGSIKLSKLTGIPVGTLSSWFSHKYYRPRVITATRSTRR